MAALVGGYSIHSWGDVPLNAEHAARVSGSKYSARNVSTMADKCSRMRWMIIGEVEAVGCEVLGALDANMRGATPVKNTYKQRHEIVQ